MSRITSSPLDYTLLSLAPGPKVKTIAGKVDGRHGVVVSLHPSTNKKAKRMSRFLGRAGFEITRCTSCDDESVLNEFERTAKKIVKSATAFLSENPCLVIYLTGQGDESLSSRVVGLYDDALKVVTKKFSEQTNWKRRRGNFPIVTTIVDILSSRSAGDEALRLAQTAIAQNFSKNCFFYGCCNPLVSYDPHDYTSTFIDAVKASLDELDYDSRLDRDMPLSGSSSTTESTVASRFLVKVGRFRCKHEEFIMNNSDADGLTFLSQFRFAR